MSDASQWLDGLRRYVTALDDWTGTIHLLRSVGAFYDHADADDYCDENPHAATLDALWYVDETTRARPIDDR